MSKKTIDKLEQIEDPEKREREKMKIMRRNYYMHCRYKGEKPDLRYKQMLMSDVNKEETKENKILKCDKYIEYYKTLKKDIAKADE